MIKGLVITKALPLHTGHLALIEFAKYNCDRLYVLLCTNEDEDAIPARLRLNWLLNIYRTDKKVTIKHTDKKLPYTSVSNREVSKLWAEHIKEILPDIDIIFSSEPYGDYVAEYLGIKHIMFDQKRNMVPVSGTEIRNNSIKYWEYLHEFVRPYFVKKICICGTESTGKSILTEKLARHFHTIYVPEWGRTIVKKSEETTIEDIKKIGNIHACDIIGKTYYANKIMFSDTDLNTTKVYSRYFFNKEPKFAEWMEEANNFDLHIFLDSDAPYIQDGTRLSKKERDILGEFHHDYLYSKKVKMEIINGTDWDERTQKAIDIVNKNFFN